MQLLDLAGQLAPQVEPQQVEEEMVVAERRAGHVDRDHQRIGLLELVQQPTAVLPAREEVGQLPGDPVEDGGPEQQVTHLGRLAMQHLAQQVVRDRALTAGELGHEPGRGVVLGQRHRGQSQARGPALGTSVQALQVRLGDVDPGTGQELLRLVRAELEVGGADLREPSGQPEPMQPDLRIAAGEQERVHVRRGSGKKLLEPAHRIDRAQMMDVVDNQLDSVAELRQAVEHPVDQLRRLRERRRDQGGHRGVRRYRAGAT
jgi:hypothetical protein